MRSITLQPFYSPNLFAFNASIGALVCDDPKCGALHGFSFVLQFMWWGLDLEIQLRT